MNRRYAWLIMSILWSGEVHAGPIRDVEPRPGEVVPIHTALGYSTVLEFTSPPQSVVVGDQDAFKVEFSDGRVAIKPLLPSSTTNLFVSTQSQRFNLRLLCGPASLVDFVVKIGSSTRSFAPGPSASNSNDVVVNREQRQGPYRLRVLKARVEATTGRVVVSGSLEMEDKGSDQALEGGDFAIWQGDRNLPIEFLYLGSLLLKAGEKPIPFQAVLPTGLVDPKKRLGVQFSRGAMSRSRALMVPFKLGAKSG